MNRFLHILASVVGLALGLGLGVASLLFLEHLLH